MKFEINKKSLLMRTALFFLVSFVTVHFVSAAPNNEAYIKAQIEALKQANLKEGPAFELDGKLERGHSSRFSVNGEDFTIGTDTKIDGNLQEGKNAQVIGKIRSGVKFATLVFIPEVMQSVGDGASTGGIVSGSFSGHRR